MRPGKLRDPVNRGTVNRGFTVSFIFRGDIHPGLSDREVQKAESKYREAQYIGVHFTLIYTQSSFLGDGIEAR